MFSLYVLIPYWPWDLWCPSMRNICCTATVCLLEKSIYHCYYLFYYALFITFPSYFVGLNVSHDRQVKVITRSHRRLYQCELCLYESSRVGAMWDHIQTHMTNQIHSRIEPCNWDTYNADRDTESGNVDGVLTVEYLCRELWPVTRDPLHACVLYDCGKPCGHICL